VAVGEMSFGLWAARPKPIGKNLNYFELNIFKFEAIVIT
jgi:hypothetical protein